MAVAYNDRDIPLTVDTGSPYTSTQAIAWDLTGIDTRPEGEAFDFVGATNPAYSKTGTINQVTLNGIPGRRPAPASLYEYTNTSDYGLQVGTGDWQAGVLLSTGSSLPSTNNSVMLFQVQGDLGELLAIYATEQSSSGIYLNAAGTLGLGGSAGAVFYGANKTMVFWVRRVSGIVSTWTQEADPASSLVRRNNDGSSETTNWNSANAKRVRAAWNNLVANTVDIALHEIRFWNGSFSETDTRDIGRDWFALETHSGGGAAFIPLIGRGPGMALAGRSGLVGRQRAYSIGREPWKRVPSGLLVSTHSQAGLNHVPR